MRAYPSMRPAHSPEHTPCGLLNGSLLDSTMTIDVAAKAAVF